MLFHCVVLIFFGLVFSAYAGFALVGGWYEWTALGVAIATGLIYTALVEWPKDAFTKDV